MARPGFRSQLGTLLDRTLAVLLGGPGTLAILMLQPPLVGAILGLGWQAQEPTPATYLCMAIAAIYIGCMNAATAIVRERPVLQRERMFNLNIWSYLLSKTVVLAVVCVLQMVLMLLAQGQLMHLPPGILNHTLLLLFLSLAGLAATGLGLAISAFSNSSYMAVILVPVLIIPQIVFSEVVLGEIGIGRRFPELIEKVTITKWGFEALRAVGEGGQLWILVRSGSLLLLLMGLFLSLAALKLKLDG
jgi:hypothetical protein